MIPIRTAFVDQRNGLPTDYLQAFEADTPEAAMEMARTYCFIDANGFKMAPPLGSTFSLA
jgi:hypothetical protein